jgi:DNA-binding PucR family transcriptional regulator
MDTDTDGQWIPELVADVAAAVPRQAASADVFQAIVREIPQLEEDKPLLALLASSVDGNVDTCLQIMEHRIDLSSVQAPAAAVEYARRLAQRGTPLTTLLRAYRLGHARFSDWLLRELARHADDARVISAATLSMSGIVAAYIDQTSEEMVAAYTQEREHWLRNQNAARAARIRRLLSGDRSDVRAAEATLGYRLRQYHVGVVCWVDEASGPVGANTGASNTGASNTGASNTGGSGTGDELTRLERAVGQVAVQAACAGDPVFLPRDESSAWAWLPLGIRDRFDSAEASTASVSADIRFAFGDPAKGPGGFCLTYLQAMAAESVALAARSRTPRVLTFTEVAPVAMMLGSADLLRGWVRSTLAGLAADDEHHTRLRETLLVFLQCGGSYKATAERLVLHKNTVQYRIRKAEESLGRAVAENRHDVELALQVSFWLGAAVLRPGTAPGAAPAGSPPGLGVTTHASGASPAE